MTDPNSTRIRCAFCRSADGKMTREHVWPAWITSATQEAVARPAFVAIDADGRRRTMRRLDAVVRAVCEDCNKGWMSRTELDVMSVLGPMVLYGKRTVLSPADQVRVARWCYKTTLMADYLRRPRIIEQDWYHQFYDRRQQLPASACVWIAGYQIPDGEEGLLGSYYNVGTAFLVPLEQPGVPAAFPGLEVKARILTLLLCRLVVQVVLHDLPGVALPAPATAAPRNLLQRLWPPVEPPQPLVWPLGYLPNDAATFRSLAGATKSPPAASPPHHR